MPTENIYRSSQYHKNSLYHSKNINELSQLASQVNIIEENLGKTNAKADAAKSWIREGFKKKKYGNFHKGGGQTRSILFLFFFFFLVKKSGV